MHAGIDLVVISVYVQYVCVVVVVVVVVVVAAVIVRVAYFCNGSADPAAILDGWSR